MSTFLPIKSGVANDQFDVTIGEQIYTFDVHWNAREEAWYFDMSDSNKLLIVGGVKMVLGALLGRRSTHPFFRENVLAMVTTDENVDATFEDFGTRVLLVHWTIGEYMAAVLTMAGVGNTSR